MTRFLSLWLSKYAIISLALARCHSTVTGVLRRALRGVRHG